MFFIIEQHNDLCDVSGYMFATLQDALLCAGKHLGIDVRAASAEVLVENGPTFHCHVAQPTDGSTGLCREGHMLLIAQSDCALDIAMYLTRRNRTYGTGKVRIIR